MTILFWFLVFSINIYPKDWTHDSNYLNEALQSSIKAIYFTSY